MMYSCTAKIHANLLIKAQNSTIRIVLDVLQNVKNYHIYKEINVARLNDYIQHLNLSFHLTSKKQDSPALNILVVYDYNRPVNGKKVKNGLHFNTLL